MLLQTLINSQELNGLLEQENLIMLDCRFYLTDHAKGKQEYLKGHIPHAIFVDVHHQLAGPVTELTGRHPLPDLATFTDQLQQWGITPESKVVVYDDMGGAVAARAWWMLLQQNIDVTVLNGGITAWLQQGLSISKEVPAAQPTSYRFDVSFPWAVSEDQVVENFELDSFQLIDARARGRFEGEGETIDPIAGHIPGAINHPFSDNLVANSEFKSAEELASQWRELLPENTEYVHYCGSGITSCHNLLAMNHAGIEANKIYVGSWSQWAKRMLRALESTS